MTERGRGGREWGCSVTLPHLPPVPRDVIRGIDQTEFEGFEYVNPLLMTGQEEV